MKFQKLPDSLAQRVQCSTPAKTKTQNQLCTRVYCIQIEDIII